MVERSPGTGEGWVGPDGVSMADKLSEAYGWEWQWEPTRHRHVLVRVERSEDPTLNPWSWQNPKGYR